MIINYLFPDYLLLSWKRHSIQRSDYFLMTLRWKDIYYRLISFLVLFIRKLSWVIFPSSIHIYFDVIGLVLSDFYLVFIFVLIKFRSSHCFSNFPFSQYFSFKLARGVYCNLPIDSSQKAYTQPWRSKRKQYILYRV